jgi:predicted enzyme related to lactoylglutathione lyase
MATVKKGQFVWYEDMARDPRAAISFYSDVVGWKTEPFEGTDYTMWVSRQGPLGGVMKPADEAAKAGASGWLAHVQVDDVDATAARCRQLGGKVHKPPADIPAVGRFAVIADPQGATIAVFKPSGDDMALHDTSKEGEFCWNELMTSDPAAAARFYGELLGWKVLEEMDMGPLGTYRIFGVGDQRLGGMMAAPPGHPSPPAWLYYAETADLDAALKRAIARGAKVLNGPMDVPGGRVAQLQDPQGASFALHQAARR